MFDVGSTLDALMVLTGTLSYRRFFFDDGDETTDKKLGIQRFQVAIATASCHP